jgi:hypothetical protein
MLAAVSHLHKVKTLGSLESGVIRLLCSMSAYGTTDAREARHGSAMLRGSTACTRGARKRWGDLLDLIWRGQVMAPQFRVQCYLMVRRADKGSWANAMLAVRFSNRRFSSRRFSRDAGSAADEAVRVTAPGPAQIIKRRQAR